jgi:hypothetical protein
MQPPRYYPPRQVGVVKQRRWGLFALGCSIFGGAFIGSLIESLNEENYYGMIPIAGPFLLFAEVGVPPNMKYGTGTRALDFLDGLAQAAGVTLAILGLTLTKKVPIYALPTGRGLALAGRW